MTRKELLDMAKACESVSPSSAHSFIARIARHLAEQADHAQRADAAQPMSARKAARLRTPLDGADAQALEHALTITEKERDAALAELDAMTRKADEYYRERDEARAEVERLRLVAACHNAPPTEIAPPKPAEDSKPVNLRMTVGALRGWTPPIEVLTPPKPGPFSVEAIEESIEANAELLAKLAEADMATVTVTREESAERELDDVLDELFAIDGTAVWHADRPAMRVVLATYIDTRIDRAHAAGRREAFEEAAKECERLMKGELIREQQIRDDSDRADGEAQGDEADECYERAQCFEQCMLHIRKLGGGE